MTPNDVVSFWAEAGSERWFAKDEAFDQGLRARFEAAHHAAARGEFATWAEGPAGALALVLLLDQIPRNIFRGSAHAFATDPLARAVADQAITRGFDAKVDPALKVFFYLPFEHAEDAGAQARSVALISALNIEHFTRYALLHRDIIARFGRFPHRNAALGRLSTPEETEFLAQGGFKG